MMIIILITVGKKAQAIYEPYNLITLNYTIHSSGGIHRLKRAVTKMVAMMKDSKKYVLSGINYLLESKLRA